MLSSVLGVKCKTETEREVSAVSLQGSFEKHAGYAFHASVEFNHLQRAVTNRKLRTSFFLIFLRVTVIPGQALKAATTLSSTISSSIFSLKKLCKTQIA
uniref:Uncharacterized protein n=1 Tax=Ditylenchus dipsaci TaxID=166011 RepID=A0A915DMA7_9BILA